MKQNIVFSIANYIFIVNDRLSVIIDFASLEYMSWDLYIGMYKKKGLVPRDLEIKSSLNLLAILWLVPKLHPR